METTPSTPTSAPSDSTLAALAERSGLQKLMWFGVLQLAGFISGWVGAYYFVARALSGLNLNNLGPNPSPAQVSAALGPVFSDIARILPVVAAVQIAAVFVLVLAFWQLKGVDRRFSTPAVLTLLLVVGALVAAVGAVPLFNAFPDLISQAPATPGSTLPAGFASAIGALVAYFLLIAVGGILAVIGLIGGQILGLWRAGSKYNETLLKLGGIFTVIPLLDVVAPVLIIVGAHEAKNRIPAPV